MNNEIIPENIPTKELVGFINKKLPKLNQNIVKDFSTEIPYKNSLKIKNLLTTQEIEDLKIFFFNNKTIMTKRDTVKLLYGQENDGIKRSSYYDKKFANQLSERINQYLQSKEYENYELIGINPLIRFIYYYQGGQRLIPHYDISVKMSEELTTFKSLIIYLNDSDSGKTNFLKDIRTNKEVDSFENFPIEYQQKPEAGLGLIFNHGVFHESENITKQDTKLILTTEICYKKLK